MVAATADLQKTVKQQCLLEFAGPKVTIVGSREKIAQGLALAIGDKKAPNRGGAIKLVFLE